MIEISRYLPNRMKDWKMPLKKLTIRGVNESLVLVDDLAFIVNVPNRTVITAMEQGETNSNVFTNIDGAVIM